MKGSDLWRRYPALGFLLASALLALILPSGLRVALTGPSELAELGPVPGDSEAQSDIADLSGATSKGGPGSDGVNGSRPDPGLQRAPGQPKSSVKRCVGRPARQTEDELSPPCVPFFEGNNFGATMQGVTADEILVILHLGNAGRNNPTRFDDYNSPAAASDSAMAMPAKAYRSWFTDRYQTYGRTLRLLGYRGHYDSNANAVTPANIRADVDEIAEKKPFAVVPLGEAPGAVAEEASRRGLMVFSHLSFARATYEQVSPRLWSWAPSHDETARAAGNLTCTALRGRTARFSGNPTDTSRTRKFGLLVNTSVTEVGPKYLGDRLAAEFAACGIAAARAEFSTTSEIPTAVASLRADEVTTVVLAISTGDGLGAVNAAQAIGWSPEWFFPRQLGNYADDSTSARLYPRNQWANAFGVSFDYRRGHIAEQMWARALAQACADCSPPNSYYPYRMYEVFSLLFYGIQSAGPRLTPASIDKGLHAIDHRPSEDPRVPAAYFTPGDWSWVKDAKAMWWDSDGVPPGSTQPGCYRLYAGGIRFRPGEWPSNDDGFFAANQPCQGNAQPG